MTDDGRMPLKQTIHLPVTDFSMRAGLPKLEPKLLKRWDDMGLYARQRAQSKGREPFVLHDGPPYANGHLHIGHALNKILKDMITRSQQMLGKNANYVPGWDCHGLPIEWKVEEGYRSKGKDKNEVDIVEFRRECRQFAEHWLDIQSAEFQRMGVLGDWETPYTTMTYPAEATIASELLHFARTGQLYRGDKPVMWSVVEQTALAEAEVEYHEHLSTTVFVRFPLGKREDGLTDADLVIWTTTPWTLPANRGIAYGADLSYGLYEVTQAAEDNWLKVGSRILCADKLAPAAFAAARVEAYSRCHDVDPSTIGKVEHPLRHWPEGMSGYGFDVPVLPGDFVTDEQGTGFVHMAPGHGIDDFALYRANLDHFKACGTDRLPKAVDEAGVYTHEAPGFEGARVYTQKGKTGDANEKVIAALMQMGRLMARGRLKHSYPHSWRSKAPLIYRNTDQWFIAMGQPGEDGVRDRALRAIEQTAFFPESGRRRLQTMVASRPDWLLSRQRAWGVPMPLFVHKKTHQLLVDDEIYERIRDIFTKEGSDAWFARPAADFLGPNYDPDDYEQVKDILDVWFDSGSTHAFVLEAREDLTWPADLYLEGSDQHRGWFQSSLLQACGTRGQAPYKQVLTHGFVLDEQGRKMSKSLGNITAPEKVINESGADILRLWVASSDYREDLRIGSEILKTHTDAYRKIRNTLRYLLGNLGDHRPSSQRPANMPVLERAILHRLHGLDDLVQKAFVQYDFAKAFHAIYNFCTVDLSAMYFDIRKDALYCDAKDSPRRQACLYVLDILFERLVRWLAPILPFTTEEAFMARHGEDASVHLTDLADLGQALRDDEADKIFGRLLSARKVMLGAIEEARSQNILGGALEAELVLYDSEDWSSLEEHMSMAELALVSSVRWERGNAEAAFSVEDISGLKVSVLRSEQERCGRCWTHAPDVHPHHYDHIEPASLCRRCDDAVV
ncbi:MAG: isoleucine--tRNA ligase [Alphaproteobacteria bacterium]